MVTRAPEATGEHDRLIRMMLDYFTNQGYTNLRADLENYTQPDQIGDHIPDLTCNKNDTQNTFIILEAETCETISHEHTEDQWTTFYSKSREINGEFHLVVPRTCNNSSGIDVATQRLLELRINANQIWRPRE